MGHGMCLSGHDKAHSKANIFGVDKLYDPACHGPTPKTGLTLYFRTIKPLTLSMFGGGWRAFWWWSKDGLWPVGARDVLQDRYGTCTQYDYYCFQVPFSSSTCQCIYLRLSIYLLVCLTVCLNVGV